MPQVLFDEQAALSFLVAQASHIETTVYQKRYPDIQYPGLIPVDTSAAALAKTVTYYSSDKFGEASWLNGNAGDVPMAGTEKAKFDVPVHSAGIGYGYGWEEIEQARMLGQNLPNDDAMAARRAYEEMVDRVALLGDSEKGFEGLFNHSTVPTIAPITGTWATATADEILADVNNAIAGVHNNTNTVAMPDTLLLPWTQMHRISTLRIPDTELTVLEFLRRNNAYTAMTGQALMIRGLRLLDTAGAGSTARMVTYRRDSDVLKLHIPMPHRFLPAFQADALNFQVPGVFRLGGLDVKLPNEVAYTDGL